MVWGVVGRMEEGLIQWGFYGPHHIFACGRDPLSLALFFVIASIIPLAKFGVGDRTVAVEEVRRRLTSKVALSAVSILANAYLLPFKLGLSIKGIAEAITHSLNQLIVKHASDEGLEILKVDPTNAPNIISIVAFIEGVRQHFPSLSVWIEYCYAYQTLLFGGESVILSCCGNPLGPLLFTIALLHLIRRIGELCPRLVLNGRCLDDDAQWVVKMI